MKIQMLSTQRGSPDGVSIETYLAGENYDLTRTERTRDLARVFVREGWAEDAERPVPAKQAVQDVRPAAPAEEPRAARRR
jgi:hypothetical protein